MLFRSPQEQPSLSSTQVFTTAEVQLPNGRPGLLVDTGAWGNLNVQNWARTVAVLASKHGHQAKQQPLKKPLQIQGVGSGGQTCDWETTMPIALTNTSDTTSLASYTAPTVGGNVDLPPLLGLRALTEHRAVIDCGLKQLHLLGPGEVQLILPPGSESYQLEAAPSGHLILPCGDYGRIGDALVGHTADTGQRLAPRAPPLALHMKPPAEGGAAPVPGALTGQGTVGTPAVGRSFRQ